MVRRASTRLSPRKLKLVRRLLAVGPAHVLELDKVHGIVRVDLYDSGDPAADFRMLDSTAVLFIWTTGDPSAVLKHLDKRLPGDSWVCPVVIEARWRHRAAERLRWLWWRFMARRKLRALDRQASEEKAKPAPKPSRHGPVPNG